jgi:hypothetical protein
MEPGKISKLDVLPPSKDLIDLVKEIMNQNGRILDINLELLKTLRAPTFIIKPDLRKITIP